MHGDRITLTRSEQRRLLLLNHLQSGALVNAQAASLLGISIRQVRRLRRRYEAEGAAGLAHGNRGRRPVHALDPTVVNQGIAWSGLISERAPTYSELGAGIGIRTRDQLIKSQLV